MALRGDDVDPGRDRDLVARFQGGDPAAFDDLYRRYFKRLHRFCRRHSGNSHEAEEIAQEAFARALRSMHTLGGDRRFYPWMTVIAKRIAIDRQRQQARVQLTDDVDLGAVEPDLDHLFTEDDAVQVRAALDNVGARHREVLQLRETDGLSYAQIARHLDVPLTTVEARLHRARKALRREFAAIGDDRRGLAGLPILAWLVPRLADLRSWGGNRWTRAGALLAPVVLAAGTAAVVLVPSNEPADEPVNTTTSVLHQVVERAPEPVETQPTRRAPRTTEPMVMALPTGPAATTPAPIPDIDSGPVDVFVGPEGTERTRPASEDPDLDGTLGPDTGGIEPGVGVDDLDAIIDDAVNVLVGTARRPSETIIDAATTTDTGQAR